MKISIKNVFISMLLVLTVVACVDQSKQIRKDLNQGISMLYIGKHTEAIQYFNKVLEMDSTQAEAHLFLGRAFFNQAKYTRSMSEYNRAIHFNPKYGEAYRSRALLWKVLGDNDKFCEDYIRAEDLGVKNLTNYTSKCRKAKLYKQ